MTAPGAVRRFSRPVPRWTPPLAEKDLAAVLNEIHRWQPFDGDALLDAAAALDDLPPAAEDAVGIAERLRSHRARLVAIAVAAEEDRRDATTAQLIAQVHALTAEDGPGDCWPAARHLRRMGWIASELLDRLVGTSCLREVA